MTSVRTQVQVHQTDMIRPTKQITGSGKDGNHSNDVIDKFVLYLKSNNLKMNLFLSFLFLVACAHLSLIIHTHSIYSVNSDPNDFVSEENIEYYHIEDAELAWQGAVQLDLMNWNEMGKLHLVVAHCDNDLEWLNTFSRGRMKGRKRTIESVTVYSKCGIEPTGLPKYANVTKLDNVGRCDHSYSYFMNQVVANDSGKYGDNDVVFFVKDNPYQARKGHWRRFNDMIAQATLNGFSCALRPDYFLNMRDMRPSVFHFWDLTKTFNYKKMYERRGGLQLQDNGKWALNGDGKNTKTDEDETFTSNFENLEAWTDFIGFEAQKPFHPVCYGGVFATTISRIRNRAPLWTKIEKSLSRADNLEEGHFAERSWATLLMKPLSTDGIKLIDEKLDDAACKNYHHVHKSQYFSDRCGTLLYDRTLTDEWKK